MARAVLFRDYDGTEYWLETPLTRNIDLDDVRRSLSLPRFVDTQTFLIERALVTIWAATNAHRLRELYPDIVPKNFGPAPIAALLFGGAAVRMRSPSSNDPGSPFFRILNDVDFIAPKKRCTDLVHLLAKLADMYGTRYYHFVSTSDRRFNAMRGGWRYRVRTIDKIAEDGTPIPGVLDILADWVDLRHKVDVRDDFKNPAQNTYTISLENILLTKCQFIFDAPKALMPQISEAGLEYRVLNYPFLKSDRIVMGMEEKDIKDVCAILADNPVGDTPGSISTAKINRVLQHDKRFALTFRLNLQNIVERTQIIETWKIGRSTMSRILEGSQAILKGVHVVEKRWSSPWWNVDVETPEIFGKGAKEQ